MGPDICLRWIPSVSVAHIVGRVILNLSSSQPRVTVLHAAVQGRAGPPPGGLAVGRFWALASCWTPRCVLGTGRAHAHSGPVFPVLSPSRVKTLQAFNRLTTRGHHFPPIVLLLYSLQNMQNPLIFSSWTVVPGMFLRKVF